MSKPRFLIVHGCIQNGASAPEWPTVDDPFAVRNRPDGCWFSWRMLGSNNRELGRGATIHASEQSCLAAMARTQAAAARSISFIGLGSSGLWWWQLEVDGAPAAVAGRSYQRQRECRYNLDQFMMTWPVAVVPAPSPWAEHEGSPDGCVVPPGKTRQLPGGSRPLRRSSSGRLGLAR